MPVPTRSKDSSLLNNRLVSAKRANTEATAASAQERQAKKKIPAAVTKDQSLTMRSIRRASRLSFPIFSFLLSINRVPGDT